MPRIRHIGGHGSILTAKMGHNRGPAWDPTGKFYAYQEKYFSSGWGSASGVVISTDGTRLFMIMTISSAQYLCQFDLPTPFDVSSIVGLSPAATVSLGSGVTAGLDVSPDGTRFIYRINNGYFAVVSCPTPWSLTSATNGGGWSSGLTTGYRAHWMSADGSNLYILGASTTIYKFAFSTAWTPAGSSSTTLSEASFFTPLLPLFNYLGGNSWFAGRFSSDGKRFFGYTAAGSVPYHTLWSIDLDTPNDMFSTRAPRGLRQLYSMLYTTGSSRAQSFCFGESGKSIFYITPGPSSSGYVTREKFSP